MNQACETNVKDITIVSAGNNITCGRLQRFLLKDSLTSTEIGTIRFGQRGSLDRVSRVGGGKKK